MTISGNIGLDDLRELLLQAWQHPIYSRIERAKWNLLNANTKLSLEDLFEFSQWIAQNKQGKGAKIIAIVASDDLMFGVSRMFHAIQENLGWTIAVFRAEGEAIQWLNEQ